MSITVTQGATTVNAIPLYVSATQVNAIMPSNAPIGAVQVVVKYNNLSSLPSTAQVAKTNVALFTIPFSGMGPGAIVNFVNGAVSPVNSLTAPATPNQTEYLFGTGLGASLNGDDTNPPQKGSLPVGVTVRVGNKSVAPSYSGRSSCCAGEDEITFTVPPDTLLGCYVPVQVVTSDGTPSNVATMAISSDGSPCKDAANPYGTAVAGKPGTVLLERVVATAGSGAVAVSTTLDTMLASFRQETGGPFAYNPMYSLPPAGSCSAYLAAGDPTDEAQAQFFVLTGKALDAGPLTVNNGTTSAGPTEANGLYVGLLGQSSPGDQSGAFLTGGPYVVSGAGGLDVGSFHVTLGDPPGNTWTTGDGSTVVNRANGLTVNWSVTGGDPSKLLAIVMGANADSVDSRTEIFTCTANAGDGTLTVPPAILSRIPVTRGTVGLSMGAVVVGMLPLQPQATFSATGLDYGFADSIGLSAQFVTFQ